MTFFLDNIMSYYKYLQQYSGGFLRKYQTGSYGQLARSSRYADIVHMNATSTLSIDEDLSLNISVPFNLTNFLAFGALVYWYFYHVDMYAANSLKNRLRSYHNYKMWSRLEISIYKNNSEASDGFRRQLMDDCMEKHELSYEQLDEIQKRVEDGENPFDVLASWGLKVDRYNDKLVKI